MSEYPNLLTSLTPRVACERLYDLAAKVPKSQVIVELGVYRARTTVWLAAGAQSGKGAHVYGVDPWDDPSHRPVKARFARAEQRHIAEDYVLDSGYDGDVELIQGYSDDVGLGWDGPKVGLLYVDAVHTYEAVMDDFAAWGPHLARAAHVVFDDYEPDRFPGVVDAVDDLYEADAITKPEIVGPRTAFTRVRARQG